MLYLIQFFKQFIVEIRFVIVLIVCYRLYQTFFDDEEALWVEDLQESSHVIMPEAESSWYEDPIRCKRQ